MAHRVVIVGAGFGGLNAAKGLKNADVEVTVIDKRNFHLFQPLLYQVATGALSPGEIAAPIRGVLRKSKNTHVFLGTVTGVDPEAKTVQLEDGAVIPYDTLIVATGSTDNYFGHPEWAALAPGLKSVENATEIRRRILMAFENAVEKGALSEAELLTNESVGHWFSHWLGAVLKTVGDRSAVFYLK